MSTSTSNENKIISRIFNNVKLSQQHTVIVIGEILDIILDYLMTHVGIIIMYEKYLTKAQLSSFRMKFYNKYRRKVIFVKTDILADNNIRFDYCFINVVPTVLIKLLIKFQNVNFSKIFAVTDKIFSKTLMSSPCNENYTRNTVLVQLMYIVSKNLKFPKNANNMVRDMYLLEISSKGEKYNIDWNEFFRYINLAFIRPNKTLLTNLSSVNKNVRITGNLSENNSSNIKFALNQIFTNNRFTDLRPSKMYVEDFIKTLLIFKQNGISF